MAKFRDLISTDPDVCSVLGDPTTKRKLTPVQLPIPAKSRVRIREHRPASLRTVEQVADELLRTYLYEIQGRPGLEIIARKNRNLFRESATPLIERGVAPGPFLRWAMARLADSRGGAAPSPFQILSPKCLGKWIDTYTRWALHALSNT